MSIYSVQISEGSTQLTDRHYFRQFDTTVNKMLRKWFFKNLYFHIIDFQKATERLPEGDQIEQTDNNRLKGIFINIYFTLAYTNQFCAEWFISSGNFHILSWYKFNFKTMPFIQQETAEYMHRAV